MHKLLKFKELTIHFNKYHVNKVSYGSFAEKPPWPNYIISEDWRESYKEVECFTRSIFPFAPLQLFEAAKQLCKKGAVLRRWQDLYFVMYTYLQREDIVPQRRTQDHPTPERSVYTFVEMWLLFLYGLIPAVMYGPSFGFTLMPFAMKFLYKWLVDSGILDDYEGGGELMAVVQKIMEHAITALPWFVLLMPLAHVVLAVICIKMFREQTCPETLALTGLFTSTAVKKLSIGGRSIGLICNDDGTESGDGRKFASSEMYSSGVEGLDGGIVTKRW
ncbi:hypothetical protein TELCIR_12085 [Teladorsagia circumcincta]|uniref:Uncharacterized protein n=1 Tax=Teladorsagia circumcincta TaxID=45464 RepID=A0A2G9U7G2_TELCI|nr:hypothetical protein TELCIR_12085 [Teladorsagia circumcincta]